MSKKSKGKTDFVLEKTKKKIVESLIQGLQKDAITKIQASKIAKATLAKFKRVKKPKEIEIKVQELTQEFVELRVLMKFASTT